MAFYSSAITENFDIGETLGVGSYGRVRMVREKHTGEIYALKILKKAEVISLKQHQHAIDELSIMRHIDNPLLISFRGDAYDSRYIYILMEFIQGGELSTWIKRLEYFSAEETRFYAGQVVLMFEYLHSKNIIYRDLKPENLLVDQDGYLKLVDFGFAKVCYDRTYTCCGSPEKRGHGKPVDWWTLGILMYEMHAGITPFFDFDPMIMYKKILNGKVSFPSKFDKKLKSLIKKLLTYDPTKRYGLTKSGELDIKSHNLFGEDWNWTDLEDRIMPAYIKLEFQSRDEISYFHQYPDSPEPAEEVPEKDDPFLIW
ncbi:unnamed protein product [Moneuplotes crassus]|uniref:Protein kinase domain-containing protein n=1 Tax=Euplotes crassus TaxID=5936 RepID=A0AAD1XNC9_EUPCR|nr:unnamed protein product [Moneuplotes crassus]